METGSEFVVKLYDYAKLHGLDPPQYEEVDSSGPAHLKTFKLRVKFAGEVFPEGVGNSKKEAKQNAAKFAWEILSSPKIKESPCTSQSLEDADFISMITKYCLLKKYSHNYLLEKKEGPPHNPTFFYKLMIGEKEYPVVQGKSVKEAKQKAAQLAWSDLQEQMNPDSQATGESEAIPSAHTSQNLEDTDFISKITYYCTQNNYSHNYLQEKKEGPSHNPTFFYKLVLDKKEYPVVQGKSVKDAKQKAAQLAWSDLQEQMKATGESEACSSAHTSQSLEDTDFISKITYYCTQNKYSHNYLQEKKEGPSHDPTFFYKLVIDKTEYPVVQGKSVKEAKQKAAQLAWSDLHEQTSQETGDSVSEEQTSETTSSTNTSQSLEDADFISKITKYCHQNNYSHSYLQEKKEGPSHGPTFFYKVVIDKKEYPVVQGKSVKEARQKAAQLAWSDLQEQMSLESSGSRKRSNSQSRWITFKDSSKSSSSEISSSASDADMERTDQNTPSTYSKIRSEYDSIKTLGNGAYGSVYEARHIEMEKYFAIKEIQPKDPKKALQEAKVLADLLHPNIVRYYTSWFESSGFRCLNVKMNSKVLFIEMELCDGGTLRRLIRENNSEESLEISHRRTQSLKIALQILSGVEYIHSRKLIHRDLKPENILFGQDGNVRIGDFGLVTQDNDEEETVERTGGRGTPSYMAPEQVGVNYDRKVDIFALGLIFFELLWKLATGHERAVTWANVRRQTLPKEFIGIYTLESHIIKTMLSENPGARPEAHELKTDIEKWNPEGNPDQGNQTI